MSALARAEQQGIRIDTRYLQRQRIKVSNVLKEKKQELRDSEFFKDWQKSAGGKAINTNSDDQLRKYLFKYKKIKPVKVTKSGLGSVDEESLEMLAESEPGVKYLLNIRKLIKIKDVVNLLLRETVDGVLHPFFNLHTVKTFRSSSSDPNFQNLPIRDPLAKKIIRRAFYPRKGHLLLEIDYKSIEVGVSCCYHKDPNMIRYVKDPKTDMHGDMCEQIYMLNKEDIYKDVFDTLRGSSKNGFVFPQFYGDYYKNNAHSIIKWIKLNEGKWRKGKGLEFEKGYHVSDHFMDNGIKSFDNFVDHLRDVEDHFWGERFYYYSEWKEKVWAQYQKDGYYQTLTGFILKGPMTKNEFLNAPIQGSAFHCLLWSFITLDRLMRKEKWRSRLIGQIHDSIIMDVHPEELDYVIETVKRVTCKDLVKEWDWIIVPMRIEAEICEVDKSWYTKKEVKI